LVSRAWRGPSVKDLVLRDHITVHTLGYELVQHALVVVQLRGLLLSLLQQKCAELVHRHGSLLAILCPDQIHAALEKRANAVLLLSPSLSTQGEQFSLLSTCAVSRDRPAAPL
jgi:hypothetical protein